MAHIKYTKESLAAAAAASTSIMGVVRYFGLKECGGNHKAFQQRFRDHKISIDHFTGAGWSRGLTKHTDQRVLNMATAMEKHSDDYVLSGNSPSPVSSKRLRKALVNTGIPLRCSTPNCPVTDTWLGRPITIHIDHIDGDRLNNDLSNLRFLCPNCHQQTDTWGARNIGIGADGGTRTPTPITGTTV